MIRDSRVAPRRVDNQVRVNFTFGAVRHFDLNAPRYGDSIFVRLDNDVAHEGARENGDVGEFLNVGAEYIFQCRAPARYGDHVVIAAHWAIALPQTRWQAIG